MAIIGLDRLRRKLTKTIPEAAERRIREAMEDAANEAVDLMKSLAPRVSGTLIDSIGWTWGDPPKGAMALMRSSRRSESGMRITIYAGGGAAFYARFIEFGTARHAIEGKWSGLFGRRNALGKNGMFGTKVDHPGTPAQPFFYPGWRVVRKRVKGKVTRAIKKAAKEAAAL